MSLYSDYVKERLGWETIEVEGRGFISFSLAPPYCFVQELFIEPSERRSRLAEELANRVTQIALEAKCTELRGQIVLGTRGAERALRANLAYGFSLLSAHNGIIVLSKVIGG